MTCPRYCGTGRPIDVPIPPRYQRKWQNDAVPEPEPYPEPIERARPATKAEIPPSAMALVGLAELAGFRTAVTYAKGYPPHATTGKPLRAKVSILVRMQHEDGTRYSAQWLDGVADPDGRKVRHPDGQVADLSDDELRALLRARHE